MNDDAIQILNLCKHEIQELRRTIAYLKPKADAYDNISTIIRIFFVQPGGLMGPDLVHIIQKRIDELTPKPEPEPIQDSNILRNTTDGPAKLNADPYSQKNIAETDNRIRDTE